jgi:hypothetical protein
MHTAESVKSFRKLRTRDVEKDEKLSKSIDNILWTLRSFISSPQKSDSKEFLLGVRAEMEKLERVNSHLQGSDRKKISEIMKLLEEMKSANSQADNAFESETIDLMSQEMLRVNTQPKNQWKPWSKKETPAGISQFTEFEFTLKNYEAASQKSTKTKDSEPPVAPQKARVSHTSSSTDDLLRKAHADSLQLWAAVDQEMEARRVRRGGRGGGEKD